MQTAKLGKLIIRENPFPPGTTGNNCALFFYLLFFLFSDCRDERWSRFFVATFICAIAWISLYSYVMVWMITVIGFTLGIPDTVMGLTFIAAGVSVPDALSGIAVVKEGKKNFFETFETFDFGFDINSNKNILFLF